MSGNGDHHRESLEDRLDHFFFDGFGVSLTFVERTFRVISTLGGSCALLVWMSLWLFSDMIPSLRCLRLLRGGGWRELRDCWAGSAASFTRLRAWAGWTALALFLAPIAAALLLRVASWVVDEGHP